MNLTVVIPCLNEEFSIGNQLESLINQHWDEPWEIVVSDNGSTDKTVAVVEGYRPRFSNLRVVDASDRPGQPHALNVGVAHAKSEAVAFCDANDEVCDGWVSAMGKALKSSHFVAGPFEMKKLNPHGLLRSHPQEKGIRPLSNPPYLLYAGSGNMGIRKSIFLEVGGFDETMPYLFDTDFCFKVQLAGQKLDFVPDAVLHVRRPDNLKDIFLKSRNYATFHTLLYKRYRPLGMPSVSYSDGLSSWKKILRSTFRIRSRRSLAGWIWGLGWRLGWIRGCVRHGLKGVWLGP